MPVQAGQPILQQTVPTLPVPSQPAGDRIRDILADGRRPEPGGWNRISLEVENVAAEASRLTAAGASLRSDVVHGVGGDQVIVDDPSGNPIELFEPRR